MLIGFLISGALLYTSANLIAYDEVVDRVNNSQAKNKERKGFGKFLTGVKNTLAKVTLFPAFVSKKIVDSNTPEKRLFKKIAKGANSPEEKELAEKIAKSKLSEVKKGYDVNAMADYALETAQIYFEAKTLVDNINETVKNNEDQIKNISKAFTNEYLEDKDTTAHIEVMTNLPNILKDRSDKLVEKFDSIDVSNHHSIEDVLTNLDLVYGKDNFKMSLTNEIKDIRKISEEVISRLENKQKISYDEVQKINSKINFSYNIEEKSYEQIKGEAELYIESCEYLETVHNSVIELLKMDSSMTIDKILETINLEENEIKDRQKTKITEIDGLIKELELDNSVELSLTGSADLHNVLLAKVEAAGLSLEDEKVAKTLNMAEQISKQAKEDDETLKNIEDIRNCCNVLLKPRLEKREKEALDKGVAFDQRTEAIKILEQEALTVIKDKSLQLGVLLGELEKYNQARTLYLEVCDWLKEEPKDVKEMNVNLDRSLGHIHLKNIARYVSSFRPEDDLSVEIFTNLHSITGITLDEAYEKELEYQALLASKYANYLKLDINQAIEELNSMFVTDLVSEVKEEVLEEVVEEVKIEELVDLEVEEITDEDIDNMTKNLNEEEIVKEVPADIPVNEEYSQEVVEEKEEVVQEEVIAVDLTNNDNKVVNVKPATNYKKVNYQKYEVVELEEEQINKLSDKQKFIYNLVKEYGSDGLPVGIFTAMGIKMTQVKKVVSPVGEKYEADYTEEQSSKVAKIINEELNNDLYLSTNGNEKIKVVRYPVKSINVTKNRIEVIDDISSKYKVCLVKGLTEEEKVALKDKFGDKIEVYKEYIIFSSKEKNITKETNQYLIKA